MIKTSFPLTRRDAFFYLIFPKKRCMRIFASFITAIFLLLCLFFYFFALVGLVQVTIQSIYFKWVSLFTKEPFDMAISFLEIFSDFGMFFFFILICIYIVSDFGKFVTSIFGNEDNIKEGAKIKFLDIHDKNVENSNNYNENINQNSIYEEMCPFLTKCVRNISIYLILIIFFISLIITVIVISVFRNDYFYLYLVNVTYIYVTIIFSGNIVVLLIKLMSKCFEKCLAPNLSKTVMRIFELYFGSDVLFYINFKEDKDNINNVMDTNVSYFFGKELENIFDNLAESEVENPESENVEEVQILEKNTEQNDNKEISFSENDISFEYKFYGMIFYFFKRSNIPKLVNLNGMFENGEYIDSKIENSSDSTLTTSLLNDDIINNDYISHSPKSKCQNCCSYIKKPRPIYYKLIISILLTAIQITYFIYYTIKSKIAFIIWFNGLSIRLSVLPKILAYNFIDIAFHPVRIWKTLKEKIQQIAFILLIIFYLIGIAFLIVNIVNPYPYSTIKSVKYFEDNSKWFKNGNNQSFAPESFCNLNSASNKEIKTVDLAMYSTLPRLYDFNKDGKCFIKPSMRGLFNSTMKYIFGKNYENDMIKIYCKKMAHYPFLIITSKKILNHTLQFFENDKNITFLENEFKDYNNNDYFQENFKDNLTIEGINLLNAYENCTIKKGAKKCELEWDNFTQYYWPNLYTEKYANIPGFEMYQITVDSDFVFQPSFITSDGKYMSGTHFIVGGSFEDNWGVSFLIEAISRKYVPMLFELLIPFYKAIRSRFKNVFIAVEYRHQRFGYSEPIIEPGIKLLTELYSQFNFSHEAIFTVGHSVGGTLMKGV